jgi:hypothetical protein
MRGLTDNHFTTTPGNFPATITGGAPKVLTVMFIQKFVIFFHHFDNPFFCGASTNYNTLLESFVKKVSFLVVTVPIR